MPRKKSEELSEKERKQRYVWQKRYDDKAIKKYTFRLHRVNDSKVIALLEASENKTDLFRKALLNYSEKTD